MIEVFVPRDNVNDDTVIVRRIHVDPGELVAKGQLIVEVETSKTSIDIEAPESGLLFHTLFLGAEVSVGATLFSIGSKEDGATKVDSSSAKTDFGDIKISKAAEKRSQELSIEPSKLGLKWVTVGDIEVAAGFRPKTRPSFKSSEDNDSAEISLLTSFKKEPLSKRKQVEIKALEMGRHHSTSSTIAITIKTPGCRVVSPPFLFENSISDLIVFEASRLFKIFPELNSAYLDSKTYGKFNNVNFGWSFDNGANLKVLAIKDSDKLSLVEIQNEVERLLELYESEDVIPMDLLNSTTVTISDLSKTEASFMLPLINGFQSLILGVISPNANEFEIYATFDHRVSEGLSVTNFLVELKKRILTYFFDQNHVANLKCHACEKTMANEILLRNRGFIKITLSNGSDANLCRNCFEGW